MFRASSHLAFLIAIVTAMVAWDWLERGLGAMFPWAIQNILAGLAFFVAFGLAWVLGVLGGTLGWFAGRRLGKSELGGPAGVIGFWVGLGISLEVTGQAQESGAPPPVLALLALAFPLMGPWLATRWVADPALRAWAATRAGAVRLGRVASDRLILTRPIRLDARGLVLGLLAALLAGAAAFVGAFSYPEAVVLAQRIHIRNEPINTPAGPVELARIISLAPPENPSGAHDGGIIILQIDDWTQAKLMTSTSESAVNAVLLRKLAVWGSRHIVLPVAATEVAIPPRPPRRRIEEFLPPGPPLPPPAGEPPPKIADAQQAEALNPANPPLDREALARAHRDFPSLIAALRANNRAMLCLLPRASQPPASLLPADLRPTAPPPAVPSSLLEPLLATGRPMGTAEFAPFYVRQLQSLRIADARGRWALPLLLATGEERSLVSPEPSAVLTGSLMFAGHTLRLAAPGRLLVNVYGSRPGAIFPHVSYSAVLNGERLYDRRVGRWVPPEQFFPDRIVFLDTLNQPSYDTPVGPFRATELLAMVTDNVLMRNTLVPPSPDLELFLLLFFGALAGHLSIGRSPLAGAARVAALVVCYGLASAILFALGGVWLPTVSVTLASALAYLLVIQFVFSADEMELERQRSERGQLEQEVAISRAIQTSLLPAGHLRSGAFEIVSRSEPAREVGGDFFNLFPIVGQGSGVRGQGSGVEGQDDRDACPLPPDPQPLPPDPRPLTPDPIGIVLGDVSGKGVQGAMYMTVATTLVEARAEAGVGPEEVLAVVNAHLYPKIHRLRMFVTVFYGVLDVVTGELAFASAGQVPPVLANGAGASYRRTRGFPLGALAESRYDRHLVRLEAGDTLILASDGFVEARSARGRTLGYDGFLEVVARHAGADPHDCLAAIFRDVREFSGDAEEQDDRTLVVIRHHPEGGLGVGA